MMLTIYKADEAELNSFVVGEDSKGNQLTGEIDRGIMEVGTLRLRLILREPMDLPIGSYVEYEGVRYTLYYPSSIIKQHTRELEYQLTFHEEAEELKIVKLKDVSGGKPYRLKFFLTAKPIDFLRVIVDTLNLSDGAWQVGDCIGGSEKTIAFKHEDCYSALGRVAEEFGTEWHIEGRRISLGKVSHAKDDPLPMQYGYGNGFRRGVGRRNDGDSQPVGKLYVEGGERNIDRSKYGSPTLLLPKSATLEYNGKTYHTDADGISITCEGIHYPAEDSYDGSEVYPMREGTVSEVIMVEEQGTTFYDIKDNTIPETLNYNDYRIAGERATIVFQTGALAGREFDIVQSEQALTGYDHAERRFKIVPAEIDGFTMPGGTFVPAVGDKYAIFNISLPAEYLSNASQRLFKEAVKYFEQVSEPTFIFNGEVDPIWARKNWIEKLNVGGKLVVGGHILFSDPQFHPEGSIIRITGTRQYLHKPYHIDLTLTNGVRGGSFAHTLGKLEAEPVLAEARERRARALTKRGWQEAKESQAMLQKAVEALGNFEDGISPMTVQTMQVLVGSEALQFRFVQAVNDPRPKLHRVIWQPVGARVEIEAGVIQHRTLGIETITNKRKASDYRYWSLPQFRSPALTEKATPYYLYAKVERDGIAGAFELSPEPRTFDGDSRYYHLLVGILSSERDGSRSFAPMYGYSELTPDGLTTKMIRSADGKTYFDLERGEIGGNIKFRGGSLDAWADDTEQAIDDVGKHPPYIGDNGNWFVWNAETKAYVDSGRPAQGDNGKAPKIINGYWHEWDGTKYTNTGIIAEGKDGKDAVNFSAGKMLYKDPTFKEGFNRMRVYNNAGGSAVKLERVPAPNDCPTSSGWVVRYAHDGVGVSSPALGGFVQRTNSRPNAVFVHRLIAKVPVGYYAQIAANATGNNRSYEWITDNKGTGKFEEYVYILRCGVGGTFSTLGFVYFGGGASPIEVDIAYATVYDMTDATEVYELIEDVEARYQKLIESVDVEFALSSSPTQAPTSGWQTLAPAQQDGQYLWQRTKTTLKDGTVDYKGVTCIQGADGKSVESITEQYYHSTSMTSLVGGSWSNKAPIPVAGRFIWTRTIIKYSMGADKVTDPICVTGATGATGRTGDKGTDGVSISDVVNYYLASGSGLGITRSTSGWKSSVPQMSESKPYLWNYEEVRYSDGRKTYTEPCIIGRWGKDGTDGDHGIDGRGIRSIVEYYQVSTSNTTPPSNWVTRVVQTTPAYPYLWNYEVITYTDDSTYTSEKRVIGTHGAKGKDGKDGGKYLGRCQRFADNQGTSTNYRPEGEGWKKANVGDWGYSIKQNSWSGVVYKADTYYILRDTDKWEEYNIRGLDGKDGTDGKDGKDGKDADPKELQEIKSGLSNANTLIQSLEKAQKALEKGVITKANTKDIQYLLDAFKKGKTEIAGGLLLTNEIVLSDTDSGQVTSSLSGQKAEGAKSLRLGIEYDPLNRITSDILRERKQYDEWNRLTSNTARRDWLRNNGYVLVKEHSKTDYWIIYDPKAPGVDRGTEQTALSNDGTAHFGNLYIGKDNVIEYKKGLGETTYLQIGGNAPTEYQIKNKATIHKDFPLNDFTSSRSGDFSIDRFLSAESNRQITLKGKILVSAFATKVWRPLPRPDNPDQGGGHRPPRDDWSDEYGIWIGGSARVTARIKIELCDGDTSNVKETYTSNPVSVSASVDGGSGLPGVIDINGDYQSNELSFTLSVPGSRVRENDRIVTYLVVGGYASEESRYTATSSGLVMTLPYDASKPQVFITESQMALAYSRSMYALFNYNNLLLKLVGDLLHQGNFTLQGDLKVTGNADFDGVPLAGACFNKYGFAEKSFGKYCNRYGRSQAEAEYSYSTKMFTVYHSIPHSNYVPVLTMGEHKYGDTPSYRNIQAYSFQVVIGNFNGDWNQHPFSYVAFKGK